MLSRPFSPADPSRILIPPHMFAKTAAPPNSAPTPMAAVLAGWAGLLVLADETPLVAELSRLETLALRLLVMLARSELRLEAAPPVAVASTLLMELAREAAFWVSDDRSELRSDRCDDTPLPTPPVGSRLAVVTPEAKDSTAEVAPAMAEVTAPPREESSVTDGRRPSSVVVSAWKGDQCFLLIFVCVFFSLFFLIKWPKKGGARLRTWSWK